MQGLEVVRGCRGMNVVGGDLVEVKIMNYCLVSFTPFGGCTVH